GRNTGVKCTPRSACRFEPGWSGDGERTMTCTARRFFSTCFMALCAAAVVATAGGCRGTAGAPMAAVPNRAPETGAVTVAVGFDKRRPAVESSNPWRAVEVEAADRGAVRRAVAAALDPLPALRNFLARQGISVFAFQSLEVHGHPVAGIYRPRAICVEK